jgi:hypothetical protein
MTEEKKEMTTADALKYLNLSRGTFFNRVAEKSIRPTNFNPGLRKQHKPMWSIEDLDKIKNEGVATK